MGVKVGSSVHIEQHTHHLFAASSPFRSQISSITDSSLEDEVHDSARRLLKMERASCCEIYFAAGEGSPALVKPAFLVPRT